MTTDSQQILTYVLIIGWVLSILCSFIFFIKAIIDENTDNVGWGFLLILLTTLTGYVIFYPILIILSFYLIFKS